MSRRKRSRPDKRASAADMARTGWGPGMLQDDSRELSLWLAGRPDAMMRAREAADAISKEKRMSDELKPAVRWYCVSDDGAATLCIDEEDAKQVAAEAFLAYPRQAPYAAVQMLPMTPEWQAAVMAAAEEMGLRWADMALASSAENIEESRRERDAARARLAELIGGAK